MNKLYNLALGHLSKHIRFDWLMLFSGMLLTGLLLRTMISPALAETENAQYRFAVVQMSTILSQSPQSEAASEALRKRYIEREEALAKEQAAVQQAEEAFLEKQRTLPADELVKLESQLRKSQRDLKRSREDFREEVRLAKDQALSDLKKNVSFAIEVIRQQENIDIIFRESDYLVASPRVDITKKVLAYLYGQFQTQSQSEPVNVNVDADSEEK
ncbi:MAG: Outer membrane chaperone Skp (OmpH) [uncultured Thiotrichaceae bacterium]|uniref:Outer membrane chaperone Skp (OmpH) n=1 Tax=uncultured Thiotrichaceae bacterium TaxID=298394 RepID=A0A6S6TZL4_9GAMM|nr:MAG: Outer membrane chaperone Skp (OmpH) [uncultured Thiotrichaceae bacterium]